MISGLEDSTVLGLAGIIAGFGAALMSFWWNYKTRALSHREFLYQKQIEGYLELSAVMTRLLGPCYDLLIDKELTPRNRVRLWNMIYKMKTDLRREVMRCQAILPIDVVSAVNGLSIKLSDIPKLKTFEEIIAALVDAESAVYKSIRKNAGVRPLTEDMRRAFGQR